MRRGDRIYTKIYPTKEADRRSVWTRNDAEEFSNNFAKFRPFYLRLEHDKTDDGIVGEVLDFHYDHRSKWGMGNCRVHDPVQLKRIQDGEIDSVSFSFTETSTHLNPGEVSLVSKPYFEGAKIISNYNESGGREVIVPAKSSKNFFLGYINDMNNTAQNPASASSSSSTPEEMAEEILNIEGSTQTSEQMFLHSMSPEQRAQYQSLSPEKQAAMFGEAIRKLDEKSARLSELEAREAQRQQALNEERLNQARPLVEKISARTMAKNLTKEQAEAAKLGMAQFLTADGNQWAAKLLSGTIEENERLTQQFSALQKQVTELRDLTHRTQAANQAGIRLPQQQVIQHAYNQELGAKTAGNNMSSSFDQLFGEFRSSSITTSSSSSSSFAPSEEPVEHNYSRGFKRDASGTTVSNQIPRTAFSARMIEKLNRDGSIASDKQGKTEEREITHNYSLEMGRQIGAGANMNPDDFHADVITTNLANTIREQSLIRGGRTDAYQESWAAKFPKEFDELVASANQRNGPAPTNPGSGVFGFEEWKAMSSHERRAHPELSFMEAPGFIAKYGYKLDTSSRHTKRQRK